MNFHPSKLASHYCEINFTPVKLIHTLAELICDQ